MSHDLFAAFGDNSSDCIARSPAASQTVPVPDDSFGQVWASHDTSIPNEAERNTIDRSKAQTNEQPELNPEDVDGEDDDFGDFEDASASAPIEQRSTRDGALPALSASHPLPRASAPKSFPPKAAAQPPPPKATKASAGLQRHPFADHMDLLFDAGADEYDAGNDELADLSNNPEAAMAYSKRIIAEQEAAKERSRPVTSKVSMPKEMPKHEAKPQPKKLRKKSGYAPTTRKAEVLFDAEDPIELNGNDDGLDEFDHWSEPKATSLTEIRVQPVSKTSVKQLPAMDLLGLDDKQMTTPSSLSKHEGTHATSVLESRPPGGLPPEPTGDDAEEDNWDDFETAAPSLSTTADTWDDFDTPAAQGASSHTNTTSTNDKSIQSQESIPPSNVPPPILLLSIFPSILSSADDALFDTMAKLDLKQRQALLAHPASHQFLRSYLGHCIVLAHIIAGRRLRWKRDQRLSQSMRIGPAAAGGKSGMKLTGLDKSEVAKEDREVLDVLRLWKGQVGKLRGAVTAASAAPGLPKLPSVPDLAETMPIKTLRQTEGGVTSPYACALCGLKREERVAKVDVEIEDSFGEWWIQGVNMHVACHKWWLEFERKLKSR